MTSKRTPTASSRPRPRPRPRRRAELVAGGRPTRRRVLPCASLALLLVGGGLAALGAVKGCGFGDSSLESLDPGNVPLEPQYEAHVAPIMERRCTNCHAEDAPGFRRAFPYLDQRHQVETHACRVHAAAVLEERMPPGAMDRITSEEGLTLTRWARGLFFGEIPDCPDRLQQPKSARPTQ